MTHLATPSPARSTVAVVPVRPSRPRGRRAGIVFAAVVAVALAAGLGVLAVRLVEPALFAPGPFVPGAADGRLPAGSSTSIDDTDQPAIARLDPELRDALRAAAAAASADGITLEITSGWRSAAYQEWLFAEAVDTYGSAEAAAQFVAAPERSAHVTGSAVDIGPVDAQFWLIEHGAAWGLCQVYANERWHFERATTPGGACPALLPTAAG